MSQHLYRFGFNPIFSSSKPLLTLLGLRKISLDAISALLIVALPNWQSRLDLLASLATSCETEHSEVTWRQPRLSRNHQ